MLNPMTRVGFTLQVQPEKVEAYKQHHREVWPEMRAALSAAGWHNYSLFIRPDGLLFGYFETPVSLSDAQEKIADSEDNARWQALMAPFFKLPAGTTADEMMSELEPIFHLP